MCAASSSTKPSSAEPRVCCQGRPRKYRPGTSVTPRRWTRCPSRGHAGDVDPGVVGAVAGGPDDDAGVEAGAVGERTVRPAAPTTAGRNRTPAWPAAAAAGADDELAAARHRGGPAGTRRCTRISPQPGQPPEQVPAQQPLRQRRAAWCRSTGRPGGSRPVPRRSGSRSCRRRRPAPARGAGPAGCGSRRCAAGSPSRPAAAASRRDERHLERPGRHHHLAGAEISSWRCGARSPPPAGCRRVTRAFSRTGRSNAAA